MTRVLGKEKLEKLVDVADSTMSDESPSDAVIGVCMLICEVRIGDTTAFYTFATDKRSWQQRALLDEAHAVLALGG